MHAKPQPRFVSSQTNPVATPELLQVAAPLSYLACETPCCDGQNSLLVEHRQADNREAED